MMSSGCVERLDEGNPDEGAVMSLMGTNVPDRDVQILANLARCRVGYIPFSYLVLVVGANMNLAKNWKPVIDSFEARLSVWKAKKLSIGGRVVLIQSVLDSLPVYFFSLFKAPYKVINILEKNRRNFLWGCSGESRKINRVSWEKICAAKSDWGLGLGSLKVLNISLLTKWWWRFNTDACFFWKAVILNIHGNSHGAALIPGRRNFTSV
ncbi:hypothetical protein L1987_58949 [Smallanthus sonchifolius]|uniref:Uncharacterized protein n=1 Tax=Smallanthus sonchifolius TaxID=185202 RepID=A0ACB9D3T7_9ASTR|nr:hypothetical protein L1987_58949 [Smallanthus sonchifolius]